jgi:pepF/M3 family oligoendopeptidase
MSNAAGDVGHGESKAPTWDLESVFPGGSKSKEFAAFREKTKKELKDLTAKFAKMPQKLDSEGIDKWVKFIIRLQDLLAHISQTGAFSNCLVSQNVNDGEAHQIVGEADLLDAEADKLIVQFEAFAKKQNDKKWEKLLSDKRLAGTTFFLNRMREIAKMKMEPEFEAFASELAVNGYHAWNRLYDKMYGDLRADYNEDGQTKSLSLGQLSLRTSSPNRDTRHQAQQKIEEAWESRASLAAMALNFQAGFRLSIYKRRNWKSALVEPLLNNKMKQKTLEAMWQAVEEGVPKLNNYIKAKKKLLEIDKFCWYDQTAPVGRSDRAYSFEQAGTFVIENLGTFSPEMADFSKVALEKRWVEAEDRPGKAGGGYCTTFAVAKQSRIFMTWGNSFNDLGTLAHELGHAYHQSVMRDYPLFGMFYPMTLAETASTFNELLVTDAAMNRSVDADERLMLLDQKLQNAHILFCNLHARYLFDCAFYKEREKGLVARERLDELMVEAQKKAFGGTIDSEEGYHKLFWASKLHFYLTDRPFYNFPYTFGFLFASGTYNRAKQEGPSFSKKYRALLADTGQMTCEQVAKKHMGIDITKPDFWREAVKLTLTDIDPFVKLIEKG